MGYVVKTNRGWTVTGFSSELASAVSPVSGFKTRLDAMVMGLKLIGLA